jgi:hypothetical protein
MISKQNHYREKVYAPWWIWGLALSMCASLAIAFGAALGMTVGFITFLASGVLTCFALMASAYVIEIDSGSIRVGKAHLPLQFCGVALALDPAQARQRRGPTADPACYLAIRGWVDTAATLEVTDPADRTPYWFISSRNPTRLVAALATAKSQS